MALVKVCSRCLFLGHVDPWEFTAFVMGDCGNCGDRRLLVARAESYA